MHTGQKYQVQYFRVKRWIQAGAEDSSWVQLLEVMVQQINTETEIHTRWFRVLREFRG